ncbi:Serine/threonine-protein kinase ark1 [Phytophthora nicotianae]|uniref:Serine/threonine-protein kinase ark1 n=1 Tax=Phytophthora nicotianae TaxID=4792 RepID=A0A0W8DH50_PHYNI|nr:Serine/threonine-protein kinase ark1 [Phytophthora nicotianae]
MEVIAVGTAAIDVVHEVAAYPAAQIERYLKEIREDVDAPVWFHFEGRNMETVRNMMLHIRENAPQAKISVEIEFPRYPWTLAKTLASLADYVFMSKDYLRDNIHILSAKDFFDGIQAQRWDEDWSSDDIIGA